MITAVLVARFVVFTFHTYKKDRPFQVLSASYVSKHRLLLKILQCLVPKCLVDQILDVPVLRIIICLSSEVIIGSHYLHFCESYTVSCYFISVLSSEPHCELEPGFLSPSSPHPCSSIVGCGIYKVVITHRASGIRVPGFKSKSYNLG